MNTDKKVMIIGILLLFLAVGCQATVTPVPINTAESIPAIVELAPTIAVVETSEPSPTMTVAATMEATETAVSPTLTTQSANADVVYVKATETVVSTWTFAVSVDHPDTGWEDYADGWDVLLPDGTVLKPAADSPFTRLLAHPHVGERPFTRSQSSIAIPADVTTVTVRAHDLVDGWGGKEVVVELTAVADETAVAGDNFEVQRLDP